MGSADPKLKEPRLAPIAGEQKGPASDADTSWKYLISLLCYQSAHRRTRAGIWSKAMNYREGHQTWGKLTDLDNLMHTPTWQFEDPDEQTGKPIQNEMFIPLENEAARLGSENLRPYIGPEDLEVGQKEKLGAKLAERVLHAELTRMNFEDTAAEGDTHAAVFGQWILKSWWDQDRSNVTRIPISSAKACPRHPSLAPVSKRAPKPDLIEGGPLFNPEQVVPPVDPAAGVPGAPVDPTMAGAAPPEGAQPPMDAMAPPPAPEMAPPPMPPPAPEPEPEPCTFCTASTKMDADRAAAQPEGTFFGAPKPGEEDGFDYYLQNCPTCPDHPKLVPFQPSMEEAATGKDYFGDALGQDVPLGEWRVDVVSPWDFFLEDFGRRKKIGNSRWWMHVHVEPLGWIEDHFNTVVEPENAAALMDHHPPATNLTGALETADLTTYDNHARVFEYVSRPTKLNPNGLHIVMANKKLLSVGEANRPSQQVEGERYRCSHLEFIPWSRRLQEAWGFSLSEMMFDSQDSINRRLALGEDYVATFGIPFIVAPAGSDMTMEAVSGSKGRGAQHVMSYNPNPARPEADPKPMQVPSPPDVEGHVQARVEAIARNTGANRTESGGNPEGVTAFLALRLLNEQGGEIRTPRKARRRRAFERIFEHGQELLYHRALEPRPFAFEGDDGKYKEEAYRGIEMCGVWRIKTEAEPEHTSRLIQQQQLQDLAKIPGVINLADPIVKDQYLELMDAPRELGGGAVELQLKIAEREFSDLTEKGIPPVIDPLLDEHTAHYQQHARDLATDKVKDLESQCGWDDILTSTLWNWEKAFQAVFFPPPPAPAPPPEPAPSAAPEIVAQYQDMLAQQPPPQPPPPVLPPPLQALQQKAATPGSGLQATELRIYELWQALLLVGGRTAASMGAEATQALKVLLRFRAHTVAHKMIGEGQLGQAAGGVPQLAAPDSAAQTVAGTIPDPNNPAVAATGSVAA